MLGSSHFPWDLFKSRDQSPFQFSAESPKPHTKSCLKEEAPADRTSCKSVLGLWKLPGRNRVEGWKFRGNLVLPERLESN